MTRFGRALYVLTFLVVLAVGGWLWQQGRQVVLTAGHKNYRMEVARTVAAQERGLSGRAYLPRDAGMLFAFDQPGTHCFWMKDMQFALDLLWLNAANQVVYMLPNTAPDSYPHTFCPAVLATSVIELNAGESKAADIRLGDVVQITGL